MERGSEVEGGDLAHLSPAVREQNGPILEDSYIGRGLIEKGDRHGRIKRIKRSSRKRTRKRVK